jgi:CheY-like chemotaxis protein
MGDAGRLQQVIWNLLSNSIKFTPDGGKIRLILEQVDRYAQITVSDTGQGIGPDFLPFVFHRFRQEDSSLTRSFGGLGLGLSLSRELVEAHGGTIIADSAGVGQGATFTVRIPLILAPPPAASVSLPANQTLSLQDLRVLVVEDEPSTLQFITFVLEQEGASVTAVASAKAALEALTQSPFDVLVSDIAMQEIDGYTLLGHIRSLLSGQGRDILAIALTAYATEGDRQRALAAGYQQHVAKPIEPDALIKAIALNLEQQL